MCPSCGGVIGRDCFNPADCAWITEQQNQQHDRDHYQLGYKEGYDHGYAQGHIDSRVKELEEAYDEYIRSNSFAFVAEPKR